MRSDLTKDLGKQYKKMKKDFKKTMKLEEDDEEPQMILMDLNDLTNLQGVNLDDLINLKWKSDKKETDKDLKNTTNELRDMADEYGVKWMLVQ